MCIRNEKKCPDSSVDNKGRVSISGEHSIEFSDPENSDKGYYYGKPGGAKPDGNEEDGDKDYRT